MFNDDKINILLVTDMRAPFSRSFTPSPGSGRRRSRPEQKRPPCGGLFPSIERQSLFSERDGPSRTAPAHETQACEPEKHHRPGRGFGDGGSGVRENRAKGDRRGGHLEGCVERETQERF